MRRVEEDEKVNHKHSIKVLLAEITLNRARIAPPAMSSIGR